MKPQTEIHAADTATEAATNDNPAAGIRWDLTSYFSEFNADDYVEFKRKIKADWEALLAKLSDAPALTADTIDTWAGYYVESEEAMSRLIHISSYLGCLSSADSSNETVNQHRAELSVIGSVTAKVDSLMLAAIRDCDEAVFEQFIAHDDLKSAQYYFRRGRLEAKYQMTPELEMLAADLGVDGKSAWGRLYQQLSGRLEFKMTWPDGTEKMVPMAQRTELVCDADERVRKAAFDGSNKAWEEQEDICAAALNHIAGTRLTLNKRRGVEHFLDVAAFGAAVERSTINAMWEAVASRRDALRDVLKYKAKLLGKEKLGFYDLAAPLPVKDSKKLTWDEAKQLVGDSFANMYDPLGEFAQHAFDQQWVEAEKRPGKRPGAFCTGSIMSKESRVFMTYGGTLNDVHTLAHELGHAYHGWVMRDLRPYSHYYPMTLAETASTFAESVLSHNMLNDPATTDTQKAVILEQRLSDVTVYMLNIHMRYMFEEQFYTERQDGTVTISRLKEMVKEAQLECYGDTLNHDELDLMFWASKLHFYITGVSFYNFPYTFGYLFSQALFQRALAEGKEFMPVYEDVLRETGSATCEDVARKFLDVDLGQPEFWANTIEGVLKDLPTFKELTADFVAAS